MLCAFDVFMHLSNISLECNKVILLVKIVKLAGHFFSLAADNE